MTPNSIVNRINGIYNVHTHRELNLVKQPNLCTITIQKFNIFAIL